jgi:hypothetical protein
VRQPPFDADAGSVGRRQIDDDQPIAVGPRRQHVGHRAVGADAHLARTRHCQRLAERQRRLAIDADGVEQAIVHDDGEAAQREILHRPAARMGHRHRHVTDGHTRRHTRHDPAVLGARHHRGRAPADAHRRQPPEVFALDEEELAGHGHAVGLALPPARRWQPLPADVADAVDARRSERRRQARVVDDIGEPRATTAGAGQGRDQRDRGAGAQQAGKISCTHVVAIYCNT